jgi:hypothetical protein
MRPGVHEGKYRQSDTPTYRSTFNEQAIVVVSMSRDGLGNVRVKEWRRTGSATR